MAYRIAEDFNRTCKMSRKGTLKVKNTNHYTIRVISLIDTSGKSVSLINTVFAVLSY
jgi:hypothetical protein